MTNRTGRMQHDEKRGVIYFFDEETGECLLRIEGLPRITDGRQIEIHLVNAGGEHHHENCGNRALIMNAPRDEAMICAVKMERLAAVAKEQKGEA